MSEIRDNEQEFEAEILSSSSLGEDLSYLLAFNASIMNLIPDGVAALDESLGIRTANDRFREIVTGSASGSFDDIAIAEHPLFQCHVPFGDIDTPLFEVLNILFETGGNLELTYVEVDGDHQSAGAYSVRAASWDSQDNQSSRILLWVHPEVVAGTKAGAGEGESRDGAEGDDEGPAAGAPYGSFFGGMLADVPIGVCELAPGLFLRHMNKAVEQIFGRPVSIAGTGEDHLFSVLPELCCDNLLETFESSPAGQPVRGQCTVTRQNGDEIRLTVELHPAPGGVGDEESASLLFLQPENADFLVEEQRAARAEGERGAAAIDDIFSRDYPVQADDRAAPVNEEVQNLLTALDLLLDFDALCERVLDMGLQMTGGISGSLMLLNDEGRELSIVTARGLSDPIARSARQRLGEGIAGSVAEKGEPLLLQGRIGDKRFRGVGGRPEVHSSVCVPVRSEAKVLGVLNINSAPDAPPFTDDQLLHVASLGRQIGGALERSRQMQRMQRRSFELAVRAEIESIKFTTGTLGAKLEQVAASVGEMLGFDICAIYLREEGRQLVTLRALHGLKGEPATGLAVPIGTGHVGFVAQSGKPLMLRNVSAYGVEDDGTPKLSILLPIDAHDGLAGVLAVESTTKPEMDNSDRELVNSVARAIGQMISDVRSQEYSARKMTMLSALGEMSVAFTGARDRAALARLVAFCGGTVLESDMATVRILSEQGDQNRCDLDALDLLAAHGTAPPPENDPLGMLDAIMVRELIAKKRPLDIQEVKHDGLPQLMAEANVESLLAIPMLTGEEMFGSVVVYRAAQGSVEASPYGEQEFEIATRLGDYAGAAASQFTHWTRSAAGQAAGATAE